MVSLMTTRIGPHDRAAETTHARRTVWTPQDSLVADGHRVVPVFSGDRPVGVYVVDPDGVEWFPVTQRQRLVAVPLASGLLGALVGGLLASRRQPVRSISMGPGGWVSFRGTGRAPRLVGGQRPWWAHLLRAHRLPR